MVKVSTETIQQRLDEFKATSNASLTGDEFKAIDSKEWSQDKPGGAYPPSFKTDSQVPLSIKADEEPRAITHGEEETPVIEDEKADLPPVVE